MKTFRDCLDKVVRSRGITWLQFVEYYGINLESYTLKAAELYGRYCRLIGFIKGRQKQKMIEKVWREIEDDPVGFFTNPKKAQ